MTVIYKEKPELEYHPPVVGVKSVVTIQNKYVITATGSFTMVDSIETLDVSNWDEMPDLRVVMYPRTFTGTSQLLVGSEKVNIDAFGKHVYDTTSDVTKIDEFYTEFILTDLGSLREVTISAPGRFPSDSMTVEVYLDASKAFSIDMNRDNPVSIKRELFQEYAELKIRCIYLLDVTPEDVDYHFLKAQVPIILNFDYKNGAEQFLTPLLVGLGATTITTIGLEALTEVLGADSRLKQLAAGLGMSIANILTTYLGILTYAVSKGWATWDDFTADSIITGLMNFRGLAGIGLAAASTIITPLVGSGKATKIASMLTSFGSSFVIASAYLQMLSNVTKYAFFD